MKSSRAIQSAPPIDQAPIDQAPIVRVIYAFRIHKPLMNVALRPKP